MNTLGNQLELGEQNQSLRLVVGGCLVALLVCGFLYMAAQKVKPNHHKPLIQKQAEQTAVEQVAEPELKQPELNQNSQAEALTMQSVSLPAPPPQVKQVVQKTQMQTKALIEKKQQHKQQKKPVNQTVAKRSKPQAQTDVKVQTREQAQVKAQQKTKVVDVSKHQSRASEQMLQQVEAGKGPSIEINWPSAVNQRKALFSTLVDCLGVGLGVLVNGNVTPIHDSGRQYSRLVRMVGGKMVEREARFHRQSGINGIAVRLFPRHLDSRLLAGLASMSSKPLSKYSQVQGVYVLNGGSLWVKNIYFDGKLHQGKILLARGACRR